MFIINRNLCRTALLASIVSAAAWAATANELADRARSLARDGSTASALDLYREALVKEPDSIEIRRDYAVVLGWAEDYDESCKQFHIVLEREPDQPVWALQEMARSELFGDHAAAALSLLERLIAAGDHSATTLNRKGLALRWLNRAREAEAAYRDSMAYRPYSTDAVAGLIYALADQDRMELALATANRALAEHPGDVALIKAKAQVLNWMSLHHQAAAVLDTAPSESAGDPELRELRIAASRWGGNPGAAAREAAALEHDFPQRASATQLAGEMALEYGFSLTTSTRLIGDSDGLLDQTYEGQFALHAGPAQRFQFGFQDRQFSQNSDSAGWRRYEAGWSGALGERVTGWASVSSIDYFGASRGQRLVGDGTLACSLSDRAVLSAGGGSLAMDAFAAVENRVIAPFYFTSLDWRPHSKVSIEAQGAQYFFSDGVRRDRASVGAFRRLYSRPVFQLEIGERSSLMWHDRQTADFYSPSAFQTHLGGARMRGRLGRRWEYQAEFGAGVQREPAVRMEAPVVGSATLLARLTRNLTLNVEAGGGTSSLDRVTPGRSAYSRQYVAASLNYRFD
jgi:tetratricopeptide (TPR) repeat protein